MKVKMTVGGNPLEFDVHKELSFDPDDVFSQIGEQPAKLAWWASLVAMKEQELSDFTVDMESRVAAIELDIRQNAKAVYDKPTENLVKSILATNDEVVMLTKQMNELKRDAGILRAMAKGFDSRSSLMATAGSMHRVELEAGLRSMTGRAKKSME